jgi:hypothetical protein
LPYIPPPGGAPEPGPPPGGGNPGGGGPGSGSPGDGDGSWDDLPVPRDEDAPVDDGLDGGDSSGGDERKRAGYGEEDDDDDWPGTGPVPPWPGLGAIPPALARPAAPPPDGRPRPGLLDLTLPWATLAGLSAAPGLLGRIGPVTAAQVRPLARAAENDPAAQWRIIVTNAAGQALTVTRIRRRSDRRTRDGPLPGAGLVGRITVTITQDTLREHASARAGPPSGAARPGPPAGITAAALRAAARALDHALAQARADAAAGGCAHHARSDAYRPPPRLREQVTARDVTCRHPACRQPAWRADLDHTRPWEDGGPTCSCNLGGACRRHHQLKQHPRWNLQQTRPGYFTWTTPAGRTYTTSPDTYPL